MMRDMPWLVSDDELRIFGAVLATVDIELVCALGINHDAVVGADAINPFLNQGLQLEGNPATVKSGSKRGGVSGFIFGRRERDWDSGVVLVVARQRSGAVITPHAVDFAADRCSCGGIS